MIKHNPIFKESQHEKILSHYGPAVYVCTTELRRDDVPVEIFYTGETPHPEFGNRYFGLFFGSDDRLVITNADMVEDLEFAMIPDENGNLHYSQYRHDYKVVDGKMIDGGRAYIRTNTNEIKIMKVKKGNFVEETV